MPQSSFQSKQVFNGIKYLYLLLAVSIAVAIGEVLFFMKSGTSINFIVILLTLISGPALYFYSRGNSISVRDGTIYYKGMIMLFPDNKEIKINDISEIKIPPFTKYGLGIHLFIVAPGKLADISPGRYTLEDIRTLYKIIHASRPDLNIPAFWLDETVTISQIRRSKVLGTKLAQ